MYFLLLNTLLISGLQKFCTANLYGKTFRVVCPRRSVSVYINEFPNLDGTWSLSHGVFKSALFALSKTLNFTMKIIPEIEFGRYNPITGNWSGMIGKVIDGQADIGVAVTRSYQRNHVLSFSTPLLYSWVTFTSGVTQGRLYSWKSIYRPLDPSVWITVVLALVACVLTIVLLQRQQSQNSFTSGYYFLFDNLLALITMLLEQPSNHRSDSKKLHSIRLINCLWLFCSMIIINSYRSKLLLSTTFPELEHPLKTFKEISESSLTDYNITLVNDAGVLRDLFNLSTNPIMKSIYSRVQFAYNRSTCLLKGKGTTREICIAWNAVIEDAISRENIEGYEVAPLMISTDSVGFMVEGFAFAKDAAHREMFDKWLCVFHDVGLVQKWKRLSYETIKSLNKGFRKSYVGSTTNSRKLKFKNLKGVFYLYYVGCGVGLVFAAIEYIKPNHFGTLF